MEGFAAGTVGGCDLSLAVSSGALLLHHLLHHLADLGGIGLWSSLSVSGGRTSESIVVDLLEHGELRSDLVVDIGGALLQSLPLSTHLHELLRLLHIGESALLGISEDLLGLDLVLLVGLHVAREVDDFLGDRLDPRSLWTRALLLLCVFFLAFLLLIIIALLRLFTVFLLLLLRGFTALSLLSLLGIERGQLGLLHVAREALALSLDSLLELLLEDVLCDEPLSFPLSLLVLRRLLLELLLNAKKALLQHDILVLGRALQRLLHYAFNHLLVPLDLELSVSDTRHILHHLLLRLHHELLALLRVHSADLEIVFLVLLHAALQRAQVVVNHEAVDRELLLGLELEDAGDCEVQRHSSHQPLDHVEEDLDQRYLIDQDALLLAAIDMSHVLAYAELGELSGISQHHHVLL